MTLPTMEATALGARLVLALVFGVAGAAKLGDREGFRRAVDSFGVPASLRGTVATTVPLLELLVGVSLLTPFAWPAAMAAFALLAVFTAGITVNLVLGRRAECRCFGQLHARPIGPSTLARNAVLAALAGAVVWSGPAIARLGLLSSMGALTGIRPFLLVLGVGAAAIIVGQAVLQWNLLKQHGRLLSRLDSLERRLGGGGAPRSLAIGAQAPPFDLPTPSGARLSLDDLRRDGLPVLLVFSDPDCHACLDFLPTLREWDARFAARVRLAMISRDTSEQSHYSGLRTVMFQRDREVAEAYGVPGTPGALLVRSDGTVGSAVMLGSEAIATLLPALPVVEAIESSPLRIEAMA